MASLPESHCVCAAIVDQTACVQVYQLFLDIDANGDGIIDTKELRKGLKRFGYNLTDAEVEQLMLRMDLNQVRIVAICRSNSVGWSSEC